MSQILTQEIAVAELTKYGVKVGDEYVNYSKNLDEKSKGKLVPGGTYNVEMYVADSGKRYINSVIDVAITSNMALSKKMETPKSVQVKPLSISNGLSKDEWADKDRRISRQGCIQAAVQVAGSFEEAKTLALQMLEFVNEK